ncbi:MAG TPA: META domain-containing protein [Candidatus Limnocylindria bacterium]|nr:META domain-containing protein [Candidatus Limnocylindria bacterium]
MRLTLVLFLGLLTSCGAATPSPSAGGDPQGSWVLVSGATDAGAMPLVEDHPITLTIEESTIGGTAACNGYGGRLEATAAGVEIRDLAWTAMACIPDEVMAAEAAYTQALPAVRSIRRDGEQLVLEGAGLELRFDPLPEPPTAELVDTVWTLDTLLDGDVAMAPLGQPATLQLRADGTLTGSTGCRPFDGQWVENGNELLATTFAMGDVACPAEVGEQDSFVVTVIGDGFVPTLDGDRLTLMDRGGQGLVYGASE